MIFIIRKIIFLFFVFVCKVLYTECKSECTTEICFVCFVLQCNDSAGKFRHVGGTAGAGRVGRRYGQNGVTVKTYCREFLIKLHMMT